MSDYDELLKRLDAMAGERSTWGGDAATIAEAAAAIRRLLEERSTAWSEAFEAEH